MSHGGLSIHCVDVASGRVATGMRVRVRPLESDIWLADGLINAKGLLDHAALMSSAIGRGGYEVIFSVGAFYRSRDAALSGPVFLEDAPYHFHIADPSQHYHLPFKFTPWGFSLFRGGA